MKELKLPKTNKPVVSIFSGGLDSTVLTYSLVKKYGKNNVKALLYNYNQKHKIELKKALTTIKKLGIDYKILDISFLSDINKDFSSLAGGSSISTPSFEKSSKEKQSSNYIANRNSILINIAVSFAETIGAQYVFYGAQSHDTSGFWDCTKKFVKSLNKTFNLNRENKIQVVAPFMGVDKVYEIKLGESLHVPFKDTWTCYNPKNNKPCGKCLACVERSNAFKKAQIIDTLIQK